MKKKPPNPYGKLGGPEHRKKVLEVAKEVKQKGYTVIFEKLIHIFDRKKKICRHCGLERK